jgi:hypothetical protein
LDAAETKNAFAMGSVKPKNRTRSRFDFQLKNLKSKTGNQIRDFLVEPNGREIGGCKNRKTANQGGGTFA